MVSFAALKLFNVKRNGKVGEQKRIYLEHNAKRFNAQMSCISTNHYWMFKLIGRNGSFTEVAL